MSVYSHSKLTVKRGTGNEAIKMRKHMSNFDYANCEAWKMLTDRFPSRRFKDLSAIARLVCHYSPSKLKLSREAERDKRALVKWFQDNLAETGPLIESIHQLDEKNEILTNKTKTNS